jgi:type I restriction-modification system DNA methylase subunit
MAGNSDRATEVSAAQVARMAGVGRAAVSNWRRRHADFPEPVGGTPASPTFSLSEIETWLAANEKLAAISPNERLWQELRAYSEEWRLAGTLADIAAFLSFVEYDSVAAGGEDRWQKLRGQTDAELVRELPKAVAAHVSERRMPGGRPFADGLQASQAAFWRSLAALAAEQGPEEVFEDLHGRYLDSTARPTPVTSLELATIVASMLSPVVEGVIFDPACGTGNLLRAVVKKMGAGARRAGQEIDPALVRMAAYRLDWIGGNGPSTAIRQGDSLRDDQFSTPPGDHDGVAFVLCDPPTGVKDWGHDELGYDPRWEFGLPPRSEPELAWLQHCYAHVRPGGTAIVVMPAAAASRRSGRRVRAEMLRRGALEELVALPPGLASSHALGVHLWILTRPSAGYLDEDGELAGVVQPARSVRMVDGTSFGRERLREVEGNWWHQFRDEPGVTAAVAVIDLLDDDVDLTPSRYIQHAEVDVAAEHRQALSELVPLMNALPGSLPASFASRGAADIGPMVSVAELVRAGAVDLILNREMQYVDCGLQPGDVLVPVLDPADPPLVVTSQRGEPTPDRHLLRCDSDVLDPYFLAGFLYSEANTRQAVTGSGVFRYDVRRARVPRIPLSEQRRYGAAFRRLAEFAALMRRAAELGDDVVRLAMDGLTSGVFAPPADAQTKGD